MAEFKADTVVLVGRNGRCRCRLALATGRDVALIDRHDVAGEETSFGNTGIVECALI